MILKVLPVYAEGKLQKQQARVQQKILHTSAGFPIQMLIGLSQIVKITITLAVLITNLKENKDIFQNYNIGISLLLVFNHMAFEIVWANCGVLTECTF